MTVSASASHEEEDEEEIYPIIAAVAAVYGDKNNVYLNFVKKSRPEFMRDPYILWNQPWGMNGFSGQSLTSIIRGNKNWNLFPEISGLRRIKIYVQAL